MPLLTILDETAGGSILHRLELEISQEMLTVRELIARRVHDEVAAYNERQGGVFQGLVQPTESEKVLNGACGPSSSSTPSSRCTAPWKPFSKTAFLCW